MAHFFKNPDLVLPDDKTIIWRYMDFPKLRSILERNSLFFSRADRQTDQFEGEYPPGMLAELEKCWKIVKSDDGNSYTFLAWHTQKEVPSRLLNCWGLGSTESRKRWSAYTTTLDAVAIRSTIDRLINCFGTEPDDCPVCIGKVRYGDEENKIRGSCLSWDFNYWLYPFFAKQDSYRWEHEVRASINLSREKQRALNHSPNGCFINVDLHKLIESVWIHPLATEDFHSRLKSTLKELGYSEIPVFQSKWEDVSY